jgi:LytS/YehU family sensor histidine kinase
MKISNTTIVFIAGLSGCLLGLIFGKLYVPQFIILATFWGIVIALVSSFTAIILTGRISRNSRKKHAANGHHVLPPQIDSVFLYNTLHNISALADISPEKASRTVEQLATFIHAVTVFNETKTTLLNEELRIAELYLQIEQARFGERLSIIKNIDATSLETQVPCFITLPLVENCVRHGIEVFDQNVQVFILTTRKNDSVVVEISDTGSGVETEDVSQLSKGDMGLNTVKKTIKSFYGNEAKLTVEALAPSGTRVSLFLPLEFNN